MTLHMCTWPGSSREILGYPSTQDGKKELLSFPLNEMVTPKSLGVRSSGECNIRINLGKKE